jgi:diaminopimelate decarboxylase
LISEKNFGTGKKDHLTLHGVDLVDLCDQYGTPLFVFDEVSLVENFERFRCAFENVYPKVMVCFSVKTNNNLAICKILREKGAYAEVSSELDLYVALRAGFRGEKIIFDGPFKSREALRRALRERVLLINVESFAEMKRLNDIAAQMGLKQAVGLRINTFRDPGFSKYINMTNLVNAAFCHLDSRFGFSMEDAYIAFKRAAELKNISVEGIMTHPYGAATRVLLPMVRELREKLGVEIKYLNIGGGFNPGDASFVGSRELVSDLLRRKVGLKSKLTYGGRASNIGSLAKSIIAEVKLSLGDSPEQTIVVEPGRFISSSVGILLVRVDHVKEAGGYKWVMVDGGTNLVPRFTSLELRKIAVANKANSQSDEEVNVVGPLLYAEDFITLKMALPKLSEGDVLAIFGCGAYTLSRSNQFLYPRPAAVLLNSEGDVRVIRERETFEDFLYKDRSA